MKKINEIEFLKDQADKVSLQISIINMIDMQVDSIKKIMVNGIDSVESPHAYNAVIGLLQQLQYNVGVAFTGSELNTECTSGLGVFSWDVYKKCPLK